MFSYDPTAEQFAEADARAERRAQREGSSVFKSSLSKEEMKECRCGKCNPDADSSGSSFDYCCLALIDHSGHLKPGGQAMLEKVKKMVAGERVACITECASFSPFINTDVISACADSVDFIRQISGADGNSRMRHTAYRLFVARTMGMMGANKRIQLPSCVVEAIRNKWPGDHYVGYREAAYEGENDAP